MEYNLSFLSPCKLVSSLRARGSFWCFYSREFWTRGRRSVRGCAEFCCSGGRAGLSFGDVYKRSETAEKSSKATCEIPKANPSYISVAPQVLQHFFSNTLPSLLIFFYLGLILYMKIIFPPKSVSFQTLCCFLFTFRKLTKKCFILLNTLEVYTIS